MTVEKITIYDFVDLTLPKNKQFMKFTFDKNGNVVILYQGESPYAVVNWGKYNNDPEWFIKKYQTEKRV
jgi:hypothetical protein